MAQPSGRLVATDAPTTDEERPEPLSFTLQVVSPSVGVSVPLIFSQLPATTSIKDLKARIRAVLPSRPSDENQRLIHRGRLLGNDSDTMADIFGLEALQNPQPQTLHLVLRPAATNDSPPQAAASVSARPTATISTRPTPPGMLDPPQPRPVATPTYPIQGLPAQHALPGFQQVQRQQILHNADQTNHGLMQQLGQMAQEIQRLNQALDSFEVRYRAHIANNGARGPQPTPVQQPPNAPPVHPYQLPRMVASHAPMQPSVQALINQQQRERAAEGRQGVQGGVGPPVGFGQPTFSGRSSPAPPPGGVVTYIREEIGPNGERTRVQVTGNGNHHVHMNGHHIEAGHVLANGNRYTHNPIPDLMAHVQARARAARSPHRVAGHRAEAMERSASNPNFGNPPFVRGGTPTPMGTNTPPIRPSAFAWANPHGALHPAVNASSSATNSFPSHHNPSATPTVYLVSSPSGPRALLVTNSGTFHTPIAHTPRGESLAQIHDDGLQPAAGLPEFRNRQGGRGQRRNRHQHRFNGAAPVGGPHANPQAGAFGARVGPMVWLVVRLIGFVWFFTSGNQSWTRWLMISGLAFFIFLINTGIFNNIANDAWAPIRAHLEALIPLAGPDAALIPAQNAAPVPQVGPAPLGANEDPQRRRRGELDPQEVANRLIEQRRQQPGWLLTHIRRIEHSMLLFVASLIPGVGERHIAAREAEAIERQRQIDAAAAAAALAAAVAEAQANAETETEGAETQAGEQPNGGAAQGDAPLIEV